MNKGILIIIFLISSFNTTAVNISTDGYGESIILPYYTVNNNLNTLITVNNSTDHVKAVKLHFREGKEGKAVLSFNLYLAPQDIWAAGIVPSTSTIPGHQGEASALFISVDTSCTPFLNAAGQEFLPYEIEAESEDTHMERSREGFIEIIEMGVVDMNSELGQAAIIPVGSGIPNSCADIEAAFSNGDWSGESQLQNQHMQQPSGGLSAEAALIDVAEGVLFSVDAVAFEHFFPEEAFILISHLCITGLYKTENCIFLRLLILPNHLRISLKFFSKSYMV